MKVKHGNIWSILILCVVIIFLFPFYIIFINSFKENGELLRNVLSLPQKFSFFNYQKAFSQLNYFRVFRNSLIVTVFSNFGVIVISSMAAYRLERYDSKLNSIIGSVFMAGLIIPFQVIMIPLTIVLKNLHLINNLFGVIFAYWGMAVPFTVFLIRGYIHNIPVEMEEAASLDGCTLVKMFYKIILPLLKPILFTGITINTFWFWNDFLLPQLIISDETLRTIPIAINAFFGQYVMKWDLALPALVMAIIPAILVFLIFQKYVVEGMVSGAVKG